jgi:hypothetical protein
MFPVHFAAQHVITLRTHPTIGEDRTQRQWFKTNLSNLADAGPGIHYGQDEYRSETPSHDGKNFVTEITLDTGYNETKFIDGKMQLMENEGDAFIRNNLRIPAQAQYETYAS